MTDLEMGAIVEELQSRVATLSVRLNKLVQRNGFKKELKDRAKAQCLKHKKESALSPLPCNHPSCGC